VGRWVSEAYVAVPMTTAATLCLSLILISGQPAAEQQVFLDSSTALIYFIVWSCAFEIKILLVSAFVVYMGPLLEYNSVIWSPSLIKNIDLIEWVPVQKWFAKHLRGFKDVAYTERLQHINLPNL